MARYWVGGGTADYTIIVGATVTVGAVTGQQSVVVGGQQVTLWTAETSGEQITDLLNDQGFATTTVTSADGTGSRALGQIPPVQLPDDVTDVWASAAGGPRTRMTPVLGPRVVEIGQQAAATQAALTAHTAAVNPHQMGLANAVDFTAGTPESRIVGNLVGVVPGGTFGLLSPSQAAGGVLLNPPAVAGSYVGNVASPPDPTQGSSGNPWLKNQQPYSATDNNPDLYQFGATTVGGAFVKTNWGNGNAELRGAPSLANRIGARFFEFLESLGGPSTGRFFELSTNPTNPANREPLLAGYGTGHATQPGWIVATRVLAGLLGVRAGGNYNSLTAVNFRGQRATTGAPTTGTWVTGDVVLDSAGAVYLCTAGGTPGTWSTSGAGAAAPTAYTAVTLGASMGHGTKQAASRLDRGADNGRLRGTLTAAAAISSGAVIATIAATAHRPLATVTTIARYSGGGAQFQIATNGDVTLGSALTSGQSVWLDSITWDMAA
ncbi:hypothetical protein JNW88_12265 [Micromonospora sp. ATA32]|nr:hypothetical protein [Micromonospora sp. ATA32]